MSKSSLDRRLAQCQSWLLTQSPAQAFASLLASVEHLPASRSGQVMREYRQSLNTEAARQARAQSASLQELYNLMYSDLVRAIPNPSLPALSGSPAPVLVSVSGSAPQIPAPQIPESTPTPSSTASGKPTLVAVPHPNSNPASPDPSAP